MKVYKKDDLPHYPRGTSFKDYVYTTYHQLVEVLGEPTYDKPSGDDKVQKEWNVEYEGNFYTIYDWKTYDEEYTINRLEEWHIGGSGYAGDFVQELERMLKYPN